MADSDSIKLCECGCGQPATISKRTRRGYVRGQPQRFIFGHAGTTTRTHGHASGGARSSTHSCWTELNARCRNTKHRQWRQYGGRGIRVCERWRKFENFLADMGERPRGMSIDRIDNNGNYEPGNCRWSDAITQANNRRTNTVVVFGDRRGTVSQLARMFGRNPELVRARIKRGWSIGESLLDPVNPSFDR